jgi:hypothetical protein
MKRIMLAAAMLGTGLLAGCGSDNPGPPPPLFGSRSAAPEPSPMPMPQTASVTPAGPVVGVWQGVVRDRSRRGAQMQDWRLELNADGTYRSTTQFPQGGMVQHWGRYVTGDGFIRLQLMGWAPREECGSTGCYPLQMPDTDTVVVSAITPQQIMTEQGALDRVQ